METKTIKISKKNYEWLQEEAGKLKVKEKKSVSIDDTLTYIHEKTSTKFSDLAGLWKINDKEASDILKEISKSWKNWKIKSV